MSDVKISPVDGEALSRLNAISRVLSAGQSDDTPLIAVYSELSGIEKQWRALESAENLSLHQSFDWCRAWVETQNPELAIIVGQFPEETAFILPLEIVRNHAGRIARFIASPYSNINTGLFSSRFARRATASEMKAVARGIEKALAGRADLIQLTNVPAIWRGAPNPFALLPWVENQNKAFQLPLLATFEDTLSQINAKRKRKKFRQSERRLETLGGYEHIIAQSPEDKHILLTTFFRQKAIRFQTLGLPNAFNDRRHQAFFETLAAQSLHQSDYGLRLHGIRLKNGALAAIAGLSRKGSHIICQFASIDEAVAPEASPGELLFHLMIEEANREGARLFDFGIGDQLFKRNWCPVETEHRDILLPISARGRVGVLSLAAVTRLKAWVKANTSLYRIIQKKRAGKHRLPAANE